MPVISGGIVIEGSQSRTGDATAENTTGFTSVSGAIRTAKVKYSFAADGGAVSAIALAGATIIPSGAVVIGCLINVLTVPTSGGAATIALGTEAAGDAQTAALISGAPWSTTGWKWATQTLTTAPDVTTAARDVTLSVAAAALTAGIIDVYVFYLVV